MENQIFKCDNCGELRAAYAVWLSWPCPYCKAVEATLVDDSSMLHTTKVRDHEAEKENPGWSCYIEKVIPLSEAYKRHYSKGGFETPESIKNLEKIIEEYEEEERKNFKQHTVLGKRPA